MLGTNKMLASKGEIAKGQTRALWDHYLGSSQFYGQRCLETKHIDIFMIQTLSGVIQIVVLVLLQGISDTIRLSPRMVPRTYFIIYKFCFTCYKVEYRGSYIFWSPSNVTSILLIFKCGLQFRGIRPINCGLKSMIGSLFLNTIPNKSYTSLWSHSDMCSPEHISLEWCVFPGRGNKYP